MVRWERSKLLTRKEFDYEVVNIFIRLNSIDHTVLKNE
jgi:hypothetical protein